MASLLRGYGLAREQSFFKREQEADVQRHRQRLKKEGKLPEAPSAAAASGQAAAVKPFDSSEHAYDVRRGPRVELRARLTV